MCANKTLYVNLIHHKSYAQAETYLNQLKSGSASAGALLKNALKLHKLEALTVIEFIECLLNTKKPQIFAESSVYGNGSDWNLTELGILGDISIAMDVEVFDNGLHFAPTVHSNSHEALLIYTPGALLRSGTGNIPVDWHEVTTNNTICYESFYGLYERRLLPCLLYANEHALAQGINTIITIPGIGCGQFAGSFKGQLGAILTQVLNDLLIKYAAQLPAIRAIYYDPFDECENKRIEIEHISLLVRPLLQGNEGKGQLCFPVDYESIKGEFSDCCLTSFVAWDHVSWPGNDFYIGSRATDDGVKAAATNTMKVMTAHTGQYNIASYSYEPPKGYRTWGDVVANNEIRLVCKHNYRLYKD